MKEIRCKSARCSAKHYGISFNPHTNHLVSTNIIPILQRKQLRLSEVNDLHEVT